MKRIAAILAAALVGLAACTPKQPAPGVYGCQDDNGVTLFEVVIIHGDGVAFNAYADDGTQVASVGPLETKGRYPHYTYRYRQGGSDFKLTADFDTDGMLARFAGRTVWGGRTMDYETTQALRFTLPANFQQTNLDDK